MYKRKCPMCNEEIFYTRKNSLRRADIENRLCRKCVNKGKEPWNKGLKLSESHKQNISNSEKDRVITWGDKISKSLINKKLSNEHIEKLKENHVGMSMKKHSLDTIIKMSEIKKGENNPMFGKKQSDISNQKRRLKSIENILNRCGQIMPNYNPKGCEYFNQLMKENNSVIRHAENGGEFYIKELGYWLDGYDIENNVVYEFDESHHFDHFGYLIEKDLIRQSQIENHLRCKFIRIKENQII